MRRSIRHLVTSSLVAATIALAPTAAFGADRLHADARDATCRADDRTVARVLVTNDSGRAGHFTVTANRPRGQVQRFFTLAPGDKRRVRVVAREGVTVRFKLSETSHHGVANGGRRLVGKTDLVGRACE